MKLSKVYQPHLYEEDIYKLWGKSAAFVPQNRGSDKTYSIVMPPPNANANLHIGYELTAALEDIAARYHRLKGESTLLLPGADHAGFETQVVYEKQLAKERKSRFDFSREELYKQIWDFVAQNRGNFEQQMRRMGVSCDWSRYTFTLDDKIVKLAYQTFKKMWDEGLIYRGERLVNFCTFHGTAFADVEVEYKEEKGHLWHVRYPLTDGSGEVVIATTRPETMLGDTAVAVHPKDNRYKHFIGKTVRLPLTERDIPIIADEMVDRKFGTGAVKITPAHDFNDYEAGKRHDLPFITVIDMAGKINGEVPEQYRGLKLDAARQAIVADLEDSGFMVETEPLKHNVGHCYKCGTVLEPLLRDQWFIDMEPLAKEAIAALEANKITFHPAAKKDQLITYLKGLRDWNISRQIAWGIPIPAFQNVNNPDDWIYDERVGEQEIKMDGQTYRRDPDVFDTWFSSSSWPYATLGFPNDDDFKQFYPLSLMETGGEILYPWVSRMIMLGLYVTGKIPFEEVYIHGYVMATDGSKMSKSVGNVVDPLPVIEKYGSDALRMGVIAGRAPAVNRGYDVAKVEGARNFCNKLWNVSRFVEEQIGDDHQARRKPAPITPADHWILHKLQQSAREIGEHLDKYRFAEAYDCVYHLLWDDFADWYVEASKGELNPSVLAFGLETILKLAHPFAPFVTETIWQTLAWEEDSILAVSSWPEVPTAEKARVTEFMALKAVVTEVREIMSNLKVTGLTLFYEDAKLLDTYGPLVARLARLKDVTRTSEQVNGLQLVKVPFTGWVNVDQEALKGYRKTLKDQQQKQRQVIGQLEDRLKNKSYVDHAPKTVVQQTKDQLTQAQNLLDNIDAEIKRFK